MEYRVIEDDMKHNLETQVSDLLNQGWKLQGGFSLVVLEHLGSKVWIYLQAMVKED